MSTFARKTSLAYVYDRTLSVYSEGESDATSRAFGMCPAWQRFYVLFCCRVYIPSKEPWAQKGRQDLGSEPKGDERDLLDQVPLRVSDQCVLEQENRAGPDADEGPNDQGYRQAERQKQLRAHRFGPKPLGDSHAAAAGAAPPPASSCTRDSASTSRGKNTDKSKIGSHITRSFGDFKVLG